MRSEDSPQSDRFILAALPWSDGHPRVDEPPAESRQMSEVQPRSIPTLLWLLQSGGFALLALGFFVALIGIVLVIRPNRTATTAMAFLSLIPAILGLILIYSAATAYCEMAASPTPPKPAEFSAVTGRAMSYSFCGLLGATLPIFVACLALLRGSKSCVPSVAGTRDDSTPHSMTFMEADSS